jgi:N-acetyltransferase
MTGAVPLMVGPCRAFGWWGNANVAAPQDRRTSAMTGLPPAPEAVTSSVPFDLQPTLRGELVELRPLRTEDFDALYAVARDRLIWEQHPDNDRHQEPVFRGFFGDAMASGGALIVIDAGTRAVIGSSRFHGYDPAKSEVEIGWTFLARAYWDGTYNKEMKQLMLRHAFRFVESVVFLVGLENRRSQRALEKIGAVRVSSRRNGAGRESYVYQITASALGWTLR